MDPVSTAADSGPKSPAIEGLNALLRGEMAAVETYDLALARFEDHPFHGDLRTIRHHHETAVSVLRDHVRNLGGESAEASGPCGEFATLVAGAAGRIGPQAVLTALRQVEEQGVNEFEQVLQRDELPQECRFAIRAELLPCCHDHIDVLAGMASAAANKG
jgi:hypothetical protein